MTHVTWKTHPSIRRHPANPVLSAKDVPYPAGLVFNAGVAKFKGRYVMVFRNDPGDLTEKVLNGHSRMGIAFSADHKILSPPLLNCMRGR
jgi:beta-1,4-mannooligosaccharide/beta-1,4-mannosyl-N-acetylglucosamine phosphorylase